MEQLETDRLRLNIITMDDFAAVYETLNHQETCEIISFLNWPLTDEQVERWCLKAEHGLKENKEYLFLARNNEDAAVGCIGIHRRDPETKAEVGYWVSDQFQSKGYASEMLNAILDLAFKDLGIEEIYATTSLDNEASDNVLLKAGFKEDGEEDIELPDGGVRPSRIFRIFTVPA